MSLLTHSALINLVSQGIITNVRPEDVNGASIDVTLGQEFFYEGVSEHARMVDLTACATPQMCQVSSQRLSDGRFCLHPGQFILASTEQLFYLPPTIAGLFLMKSSLGRCGLNHLMSGWADPSWHGSALTLELTNVLEYHTLLLTPGMKIGQVIFFEGEAVPTLAQYALRGQYNQDGQRTVPSKGSR